MSHTTEIMIENTVIAAFNKAIVNPENLNEDEAVDGINWNFVDYDVHREIREIFAPEELHFDLNDFIEGLIEEYLGEYA